MRYIKVTSDLRPLCLTCAVTDDGVLTENNEYWSECVECGEKL